jgi:hypothetical protein
VTNAPIQSLLEIDDRVFAPDMRCHHRQKDRVRVYVPTHVAIRLRHGWGTHAFVAGRRTHVRESGRGAPGFVALWLGPLGEDFGEVTGFCGGVLRDLFAAAEAVADDDGFAVAADGGEEDALA